MDLDSIAPGADFITTIEKAVGSCEAVIQLKNYRLVEDPSRRSSYRK